MHTFFPMLGIQSCVPLCEICCQWAQIQHTKMLRAFPTCCAPRLWSSHHITTVVSAVWPTVFWWSGHSNAYNERTIWSSWYQEHLNFWLWRCLNLTDYQIWISNEGISCVHTFMNTMHDMHGLTLWCIGAKLLNGRCDTKAPDYDSHFSQNC